MRLSTVGILAALGMTLTSTAVWSLTSPADASAAGEDPRGQLSRLLDLDGPEDAKDPKADPEDPPELVDKSSFVTGKTLMVEGRLGHQRMLADARGETFLFVDVRSDLTTLDPGVAGAVEPVNLAIVIDHSGSMKGQRERNAFEAASGMVRRLRDGDTVSVVAYAADARVVVPVTTINQASRERVIDDIRRGMLGRPKGNTCISCGIDTGLRTLERRRAGINRMLLLSDGEANRGVQDEDGIRVLARRARARGVTVSSIGVDVDYNEKLMSALAREGNGRHYFSETGSNLDQIFDQELESLIKSVAKDGKLVVELAPGVRAAEVFDRAYQQVDRRVIVPMGTFSAGEEKTFLMRLEVPASPSGERPIANVTLSYNDLTGADTGECFGELAAQMTESAGQVSPLDAIVLSRLTRSETGRVLQESNDLFAQGRSREAQRLVDDHLATVRKRRSKAKSAAGRAGFSDPFGRDLDDDFNRQAGALSDANSGFVEAEEAPAPAASRPAKVQIRENAAAADAFSL